MVKKINVEELPDFDLAEHLKTDEDIATYLSIVLEDDDSSELMHALGVVARARGMTDVARAGSCLMLLGIVQATTDRATLRVRQTSESSQ